MRWVIDRRQRIVSCSPIWLALVAALVAGAGQPAQGMQLASGAYTGTGSTARAITGVGFRPDAVIIKGNAAQLAVLRSSSMAGGAAKELAAGAALRSGRVQSLDADGFTVGAHAEVNGAGVVYTWVAFRNDGAGDFRVGSYVGNGSAGRSVAGLGFQPAYLVVMSAGSEPAVQRSAAMTGDTSFQFDATGARANAVRALQPDGFQVGSDGRVNGAGTTYHYVAWKASAGSMSVGSYGGNGRDDRSIVAGFQPGYVIVKATSVEAAVHRPAASAGDSTLSFAARVNTANAIQRLQASGFQVGTAGSVNNAKLAYFWAAFRPRPTVTPATALTISSVNAGARPVAGVDFAVVVQASDAVGNARAVATPTAVTVSLKSGSGVLGGTVTGTLPAGASQVSIGGVTYTKAEAGVILVASRTSGDLLAPGDSAAFTVDPGPIASYAVTLRSPQPAGTGFDVTAAAQDRLGNLVTTDSSTPVSLSSSSGRVEFDADRDGRFGDATRTLSAGAATMTARGTVAESTSIVATDAAGKTGSTPATITAGAAAALAFTTQPGNGPAGSPIPGPPTVAITDAFGNAVVASTAPITVAIGSNPGNGVLGGTRSKSAVSGAASFTDLTIGQPASGYTLTASAPGLAGATSAAFAVTASAGAISGRVGRAPDGAALAGAAVDALQGTLVRGSTTSGAGGDYVLSSLPAGAYDVRASAAGYQAQTRTGVVVGAGSDVRVDLDLAPITGAAIRILSPAAGSVTDAGTVLVRGQLSAPPATAVGVSVNGMPGFVAGDQFAALVAVDPSVTTLTASLSGPGGPLATDSVAVAVMASGPPLVSLRATPAGGLAPLTVTFSLSGGVGVADVALDVEGDGSTDFRGPVLSGTAFTLAQPGLYPSRVTVTDLGGQVHTAATLVQVFERAALDQRLQAVWQGLKDALRAGNLTAAAGFIHSESRDRYQAHWGQLSPATLANVDQIMTSIVFVDVSPVGAQYEMLRDVDGQTVSYAVWFLLDYDGLWRLRRF